MGGACSPPTYASCIQHSPLPEHCQLLGSRGGGGGGCRCFNAIISPESVISHLQHSFYSLCASLLALKSLFLLASCCSCLCSLLIHHQSPAGARLWHRHPLEVLQGAEGLLTGAGCDSQDVTKGLFGSEQRLHHPQIPHAGVTQHSD